MAFQPTQKPPVQVPVLRYIVLFKRELAMISSREVIMLV